MKALILENLNEARGVLEEFISQPENIEAIEKTAALMVEAVQNGGKIISCGNGGSMTDAMHFAEEIDICGEGDVLFLNGAINKYPFLLDLLFFEKIYRELQDTGISITEEELEFMVKDYYHLHGWNEEGRPL